METSSRAGWFAVMLGILLPGLGHVYIRQFGKGFVLNILGWGATSLTFLIVRDTAIAPVNLVLAAPWIPGFYFYMSRDAYVAARQASAGGRHVKRRWPPYVAAACLLLASTVLGQASSFFSTVKRLVVVGEAMPTLVAARPVCPTMAACRNRGTSSTSSTRQTETCHSSNDASRLKDRL